MNTALHLKTGGLVFLVVSLTALTTGCEAPARAQVKGKVKYLDKYLTAGTVAFTSKDGRVGSGTIDIDGNYEVSDAPVGECIITVKVPNLPPGGKMKGPPIPPKGVPEARMPGQTASEDKGFVPGDFDPSKIVQIPGKYAKVDDSPLTYTVQKGPQTKDITLSP